MVDDVSPGVRRALVFTGGGPPAPGVLQRVGGDVGLVVAADGGLAGALALGIHVDLVVGDLDSVTAEDLERARIAGAAVESHLEEKDETDLELALDAARARGAQRVTVVGGTAGRLDHLLANVLLLGTPRFSDLELDAFLGSSQLLVVRSRAELHASPGATCTLLAVGGPARGVTTTGLRYPLVAEDLLPGSTRGVSNELTGSEATVTVSAGTILAVVTEREG